MLRPAGGLGALRFVVALDVGAQRAFPRVGAGGLVELGEELALDVEVLDDELASGCVDVEYLPSDPTRISAANDKWRDRLTTYLESQTADVELLAKVLPDYPPGAKRPVRDDGSWLETLKRTAWANQCTRDDKSR